ncbi:MAG: crossover junction endodeoxyribonuclease RuvC [Actinobacteria bacterium]|nr:crossover junction endodeoxyribonuclease RuvC [Actinomycetota bacterium]
MRVMGVDPGLARCGVAVVDGDVRRSALTAHHLVRTAADDAPEQRLAAVHDQVADLIASHRPDVLAIERLLFNANARSAMAVAQAVGVILLAAAHVGLDVRHYTPTQVKATVTGQGDADKGQVKYLVRAQLDLDRTPRSADVADAAAVALCHLWRSGEPTSDGAGGYSARLAAAVAAAGPGAQVVQRNRRGRQA